MYTDPPKSEICRKCGKPIDGMWTTDRGGVKHPWCYDQDHPFVPLTSFEAMVNTTYDPPLARSLIIASVPSEIGQEILEEFNVLAMKAWQRRCKEF